MFHIFFLFAYTKNVHFDHNYNRNESIKNFTCLSIFQTLLQGTDNKVPFNKCYLCLQTLRLQIAIQCILLCSSCSFTSDFTFTFALDAILLTKTDAFIISSWLTDFLRILLKGFFTASPEEVFFDVFSFWGKFNKKIYHIFQCSLIFEE